MNSTIKRWIICTCVGMCVPAAIYSWRAHVHRNDRYASVARVLGVDVDKWADLNRTLKAAGTRHTLSDRELDQVEIWSKDSSRYVRILAAATLRAGAAGLCARTAMPA